jgi:protease-4
VQQKQRDFYIGLGIVLGTLLFILLLSSIVSQRSSSDTINISSKGDKVALVELIGPIYDSRKITRQFKRYGDNKSIKAIVFRIDSPGGGVAVAQEIYNSVRRIRDKGKPVVASLGSVAASGGYYVACGTDTIMANPGTTTGSIGVIAEFLNTKELFGKLGIKFEIVKSGKFKDTGSPHRELTPADKQYLQSIVSDVHKQFVDVVVRERNLSKEKVLKLSDGRVFTGNQAIELGLVDLAGDYEDAIQLAAKLGDIKGEPTLIKERRRRLSFFDIFFQQIRKIIQGFYGVKLLYSINEYSLQFLLQKVRY